MGEGSAVYCMVMAVWAVPFLLFLGYLCFQESPMIELPRKQKRDAAWGCVGSAVLYALTFFAAQRYIAKSRQQSSARQAGNRVQEMQEMGEVG
mmetsp:Transcript_3146/g.7324  ORF Transcript_3146/g.7324 Transcript_3146/m.7324 type:complete len:93 (-) Transcript_3146:187-465(-)